MTDLNNAYIKEGRYNGHRLMGSGQTPARLSSLYRSERLWAKRNWASPTIVWYPAKPLDFTRNIDEDNGMQPLADLLRPTSLDTISGKLTSWGRAPAHCDSKWPGPFHDFWVASGAKPR